MNTNRCEIILSYLIVPKMGFEPIHSKEHSPLKTACLPIPPFGLKKNPNKRVL